MHAFNRSRGYAQPQSAAPKPSPAISSVELEKLKRLAEIRFNALQMNGQGHTQEAKKLKCALDAHSTTGAPFSRLLAQLEVDSLRPEARRYTPMQISAMEEALSWPSKFLAQDDPVLATQVQRAAFYLAMGKDITYAAKRLRRSPQYLNYRWRMGVDLIARRAPRKAERLDVCRLSRGSYRHAQSMTQVQSYTWSAPGLKAAIAAGSDKVG